MALVHEQEPIHLGTFLLRADINMNFGTRPARPCIAHFPKVVFLVPVDNALFGEILQPITGGFIVAFQIFSGAPFKNRCVKPGRVEFQHIHEIFPRPGNGFFLEIIAKRPVSQHLKHRMVICIVSYLFQIIVLAAHAQAFLRVRHARMFNRSITQDNIFKLIHAGIGKH
ncbi:hypothetical protein SDC9_143668 [bioreactor metagenome]|uniref:Uncharacterized protein n=1 Tax=bioreactor metagenome TaxID=1076179 RepID=A0A645E3Y6_9ZZZZ